MPKLINAEYVEEMELRATNFVIQNQGTFRDVDGAFIIYNAKKAHSAVLFRKSALTTRQSVATNVITSTVAEKAQNALQAVRRHQLDSHIPALAQIQTSLSTGFQDVHLIHVTPTHANRERRVHMMN